MIEKEEKLTLEEQRINELLSENFDKSEWIKRGLTPNSFPPEMVQGWLTLGQFEQEGINYLKQLFDEHYGSNY